MKTVDIVKSLLEMAEKHEWSYSVDNTQRYCYECGDETDWEFQKEHAKDCRFEKTVQAAKEYLKLMYAL